MNWQKRKAMMMYASQPEPPTPSNDIVPDSWKIPGGINVSGQETSAGYSARSAFVDCTPGATVKRTGLATYDGTYISMFIHQYKADGTWLRRSASSLTLNNTETLGSDCHKIRVAFQFGSSSGKTMTQSIVDQCYGAEWVV